METPTRLTEEQAQSYLGCGPHFLRRLRQQRRIRFYKLGHRSLSYDRGDLDSFLDARKVEAVSR